MHSYLLLAQENLASSHDNDALIGTVVFGFLIFLLALFIITVISVIRNQNLTSGGKVVWILLAFNLRIIGAILWFAWGRNAQLTKQPVSQEQYPTNGYPPYQG